MSNRNILVEGLILESQGVLNLCSERVIEYCKGWGDGDCSKRDKLSAYLEAYDKLLIDYEDYSSHHLYHLNLISFVNGIMDKYDNIGDGKLDLVDLIVDVIREIFMYVKIPLGKPEKSLLSDEWLKEIREYGDGVFVLDGIIWDGEICIEDGRMVINE